MSGYIFSHDGRQFSPNGTVDPVVPDVDAYNKAYEASELAVWQGQPDRFIGYVRLIPLIDRPLPTIPYIGSRVQVRTWLGTVIATGTVTGKYRNNLNARIVRLAVRGTNGAHYIGQMGWDWNESVRLRKCKPTTSRKGR